MGGIERHVRDISEALVQKGYTVTALVCADDGKFVDEIIKDVRVLRIPRWGTVLSQPLTWGYIKTLKTLQPDVVHCHVPFPMAWLAVRYLPKNMPVVCTWHSDIVRQRFLMPLLSLFEQAFLRRCGRVIVTSPEYLESSQPLQEHRDKCSVIPLTLPPDDVIDEQSITTQLKVFQQQFQRNTVLYMGRLVGYKGLPYLIEAMKHVDGDLILAGTGNIEKQLLRQVIQHNVADRVYFLGYVSEVEKQALYRLADVLVLPSIQRSEAFGYVLLEAMSQGCPVITTDLPTGVRWVNQHEKTGLVVPPKDAAALGNAIGKFLQNSRLRDQYGKQAKRRVDRDFRFEDKLQALVDVYERLLR